MGKREEKIYWADAPATTMVFGEHAVLGGYPALVLALEPRLKVRWRWRHDEKIVIQAMGQTYHLIGRNLEPIAPLKYVRACLELAFKQMEYRSKELLEDLKEDDLAGKDLRREDLIGLLSLGFEVSVDSAIDPLIGLGSSAALIIAFLSVMRQVGVLPLESDLMPIALGLLHSVQGRGSGADLAASLTGGVIAYTLKVQKSTDSERFSIELLPAMDVPMELIYAGHKTPTGEVLARLAAEPSLLAAREAIYVDMGRISQEAIVAWKEGNLHRIASLANEHQNCMRLLCLSDSSLDSIEATVMPHVYAGKISGSGLGDCFLTWGKYPYELPFRRLNVKIASGARYGIE